MSAWCVNIVCLYGMSAQCIHTALLVAGRQAPCRNITCRQKVEAPCGFVKWHYQAKLLSEEMYDWDVLWWDVVTRPYHAEHSTGVITLMWSDWPITQSQACANAGWWIHDWLIPHDHEASAVNAAGRCQMGMVSDDIVCGAVKCGVLMQHCVRLSDDAMKWSSLINRVINGRNLMKMFCENIKDWSI